MIIQTTKIALVLSLLAAGGLALAAGSEEDVKDKVPTGDAEQTAESAGAAPPAAEATGDAQTTAEAAPSEESGEAPKADEPAPVTGAFGIPLGERFEPCMVAKVLGEEEKTYRGADKAEHKGTLYRVEPRVPNAHFNAYAVETTADGFIYAIRGMYEPTEKASRCEVSKKLAEILTEKYGKPRGKGILGDWYAFRLSLIHISEPTRPELVSRMPSSA